MTYPQSQALLHQSILTYYGIVSVHSAYIIQYSLPSRQTKLESFGISKHVEHEHGGS